MGTIHFLLPSGLAADAVRELERACMTGGPDNMPWPTEVQLDGDQLTVIRRDVDESGCLLAPWMAEGSGRVMGSTATLMERSQPYLLAVELARGKVNQLRSQAWDWLAGGLQMPAALEQEVHDIALLFGRAATQEDQRQSGNLAQQALTRSYRAADQMVRLYSDQVFQVRHQRQPRLETFLGCRLGHDVPRGEPARALAQACNAVSLPLTWADVEPVEADYRWELFDDVLAWAGDRGLSVAAGPLIDFSASRLPHWLWLWERDLQSVASFMCDYVETVIKRYRGQINSWQLTTASNSGAVLALGEEELLYLTVKLAEAARQVEASLELTVGVAQPWGEYLALEDRTRSPFIFADELIRSGLHLAGLDLEVIMGVSPRASYCRDLLETSRLLDLYALLGVPLRLTLGYPSAAGADAKADPDLKVDAGRWRDDFSPAVQAAWAEAFTALGLCKPYVRGVQWAHFADNEPHQFPHCGLLDAAGSAKPALQRLRRLREEHLR
jgi:GH35 family endo-1,4-beta-xylanase